MSLDHRLVHKINTGHCFAFIGSGPSTEVGYPTWKKLAEDTYTQLQMRGLVLDTDSYNTYLQNKHYPELFRLAERDAGGRDNLIGIISTLMNIPEGQKRGIYDFLVKWPFACYLTTNYDDELHRRLANNGHHYTVMQNTIDDFSTLRHDSSRKIIKLHGDLQHPDQLVLTSRDYQKFTSHDSGKYFRDKLRAIFETFDVVIIGYSLSDCDLALILETAQQSASPMHPVFMFLANVTLAQEKEYFEKYNIVINSYDLVEGRHNQLTRLLALIDKFISPRNQNPNSLAERPSADESAVAIALLIFRRLQNLQINNTTAPAEYLGPLILSALVDMPQMGKSLDQILSREPLDIIAKDNPEVIREAAQMALLVLEKEGLVIHKNGLYSSTTIGLARFTEIVKLREIEEDQAYGQFAIRLKSLIPELTPNDEQQLMEKLKNTIVAVFRSRGLKLASGIFAGQSISPDDLSDIFRAVSDVASSIENFDLRASFIEAARDLIVQPTPEQKKYLASLSQGYFLYHITGLDPLCTKVRRELFHRTVWFIDSSVLLPLLAEGCHNHAYAFDLFERLRALNAIVYTTEMLADEVWQHLRWAISFVQSHQITSLEFMLAATVNGSYKQNLFLDGFVNLASEGRIVDFEEYLELICPNGCSSEIIKEKITTIGIRITRLSELSGFNQVDFGDLNEIAENVKNERLSRDTYRSELQVNAEAEVFKIIQGLRNKQYQLPDLLDFTRCYFVSQSHILNAISETETVTTWTQEALYRYLTALPGEKTDPDLLQQCMINTYYSSGISFIDETRYLKYFGPAIDIARIKYEEEKEKYVETMEKIHVRDIDDAFTKTPDLEKPYFVIQMAWQEAEKHERKAEEANRRASEAKLELQKLKAVKEITLKIKKERRELHEAQYLKNLSDPKRQKQLRRRAKRRRKKK